MKRLKNALGAALCASALFATVGCDHIRDYSVNSYQGVMPAGDFRPSGSMPPRPTPDTSKPEAPAAVPAPATSNK